MPTAVIPTYNEAANVPQLVERLRAAVPGISMLFVDDGSPDGTADLLASLSTGDIRVLRRRGKQGLASAYLTGFAEALSAGAERIVQMDADLSHDPEDVPRLLAVDSELVLGSRFVPGGGVENWPVHRLLLSRGGSLYARLLLRLPYRDLTGGFKAWQATTLETVLRQPIRARGYVFQVEMTLLAHLAGCSVTEVPIVFTERVEGVSKMAGAIALEAALQVPLLRLQLLQDPALG